jgi:hypothetical protein
MKEEHSNERNQKIKTALSVGVAGGLFWSIVESIAHYINFTTIGPSILIAPFVTSTFSHKPIAHLIGILAATILAVLFSLVYVFTLSRFYHPLIGVACGLVLFAIFYYVLVPVLSLTNKPIHQMGANNFTTQLCLFVLFGLFVGFSLSTEYSSNENQAKAK